MLASSRAMGRASPTSWAGGLMDGAEEHETVATMRTANIAPHPARPTQLTPYSSSSSSASSSSSSTTRGSSTDSASSSASSPVVASSSASASSVSSSSSSDPKRKKLPLM